MCVSVCACTWKAQDSHAEKPVLGAFARARDIACVRAKRWFVRLRSISHVCVHACVLYERVWCVGPVHGKKVVGLGRDRCGVIV